MMNHFPSQRFRSTKRLAVLIGATTTVAMTAASTSVFAQDELIPRDSGAEVVDDTDAVVDTVLDIAGDFVEPAAANVVDVRTGTVAWSGDGAVVSVSDDPDQGAQISQAGSDTIGLGFPDDLGLGNGEVSASGATVYRGTESDLTVVPTADGSVQAMVTIHTSSAGSAFEFPLELPADAVSRPQEDGSIVFTDADGEPLAGLEAPWAVDANGADVPTSYELRDGVLTQVVDHASGDFAYPIVIDPELHNSWWGKTLKLTTSEMNKARGAMIAGGGAGALVTLLGGPVTWAVAGAILVIGNGAMLLCSNSKGVDIHMSHAGGIWCSGY